MYNLSFLLMCKRIFDEVELTIGSSAYENMMSLCDSNQIVLSDKVSIKNRKIYEVDTTLGSLIRIFIGSFIIVYQYLRLPKKTVLLFNACNILAFPWLLLLNRFLRKKIAITIHGDLELLVTTHHVPWKPWFWFRQIYRFCFSFLLEKSDVKIILLGKNIEKNVCKIYPEVADRIVCINHPYLFTDEMGCDIYGNENVIEGGDTVPLVLGCLGRLDEKKGLNEFLIIAKHFENEISTGKLVLKSVGAKPLHFDTKAWPWVEWGSDGLMSRGEFDDKVKSVDYILYLYPVGTYGFTASGIAMDVLKYLKPLLGFNNQYLDTMPTRHKMGFLFNNIHEVINKITEELENRSDIQELKRKLIENRECFSVGYNADILEKSLNF